GRRLATLVLAPGEFGRPIVAPPGVPAERVKILREALNKTLRDPELLAAAKKRDWPVSPVAGEELEPLAKEVIAQPPEVVQRLKKVLGEGPHMFFDFDMSKGFIVAFMLRTEEAI